jgi:RNase H-like domain found in reverse transcriptase
LYYPAFHKPFYVETDASDYAVGGHLLQYDEGGNALPIMFTSRVLKGAELRYTTTEKELLAVVDALTKFRVLILGYPVIVRIITGAYPSSKLQAAICAVIPLVGFYQPI